MLNLIPLLAEYGTEGPWPVIGLLVLVAIVGGVIYWKRAKVKKTIDKVKDRLDD